MTQTHEAALEERIRQITKRIRTAKRKGLSPIVIGLLERKRARTILKLSTMSMEAQTRASIPSPSVPPTLH